MARRSNLTRAVWFKVDEQTDEILRLIAEQTEQDNSEVGRAALAAALPSMPGYQQAKEAYDLGKRAVRPQARGGRAAGRASTGRRVSSAAA